MTRPSPRTRLLRLLAAFAITAALLAPALPVNAADVSFGTPVETATYGQGIKFSVPVTGGASVDRAELRLLFPGALGPSIIDVPTRTAATAGTLEYTLDVTGGAGFTPNTPIEATWAAVTTGGETVTSSESTVLYADTDHQWRTLKGDLMTVHWYSGPQSFAEQELALGEKALRDTNALLGVTDTRPVDFFIYGDQPSFVAALGPGTRENQIGVAFADIRTLFGLISPDTLNDPQVAATVPHELVHLVFDTAVHNPYRFPPHWLNEGLAVYLSEGYNDQRRSLVEEAVRTKDLMPLDALTGRFPADAGQGFLAYCEAVSAIDYLVRTDGAPALYELVAAYHDGLTDDEAFTRALGRDVSSFEAGWLKELGADQPERYGPVPAPAGPLPGGWTGQGPSPEPGSTPGSVAAPTEVATAVPGDSGQASGGTGTGLVLGAILGVVALVVIVLALVRRRAGPV